MLLVVTDGNDNTSTDQPGATGAQGAAKRGADLCHRPVERRRAARGENAKRALNALARESGGLDFYPKDLAEVDELTLQVAHEIRNQYTIAYSPTVQAMDGSFRQIKVTVNGPGRPVVRTRTGYYATPDESAKKTLSQVRNLLMLQSR